ncbi:hypothetical protein N7447_009199 [Penicillium robsamsonii]|uniref:uncharacterized protein n=1 Tax=Penicillium robsamsonii TaxID=1792511 RepID=UPI0025497E9E|nr:uncharacterized protein N7447_009199 [Penicillium robsamsonii]KAJ5816966.1 hypothetical protein N7447_009199 [Penicillium robsamsonii]
MSSSRAQSESVSTILREGISGYINRSKLESRLYELFGRNIQVVYFCGRISFQAQREVQEGSL